MAIASGLCLAVPALVDHKQCNGAAGCITAAMNNTGATLMTAYVSCQVSSTAGVSISDTSGNSWSNMIWQSMSSRFELTYPLHGTLWYVTNPTVTSSQSVILSGASSFCTMFVASFSGTGAVDVFNSASSDPTLSPTSFQPGSVTVASGELAVSGFGTYCGGSCNTPAISVGSSFSIAESANANTMLDGGIAYYVQPSTGALNPSWSAAIITDGAVAHIISFSGPSTGRGPRHRVTQ